MQLLESSVSRRARVSYSSKAQTHTHTPPCIYLYGYILNSYNQLPQVSREHQRSSNGSVQIVWQREASIMKVKLCFSLAAFQHALLLFTTSSYLWNHVLPAVLQVEVCALPGQTPWWVRADVDGCDFPFSLGCFLFLLFRRLIIYSRSSVSFSSVP